MTQVSPGFWNPNSQPQQSTSQQPTSIPQVSDNQNWYNTQNVVPQVPTRYSNYSNYSVPGSLPYIPTDPVTNPYQVSNYSSSNYGYPQSNDLASLLNGYSSSQMHNNVKLEPSYGMNGLGTGMTGLNQSLNGYSLPPVSSSSLAPSSSVTPPSVQNKPKTNGGGKMKTSKNGVTTTSTNSKESLKK